MWSNLLDMTESEFKDNFMIITAAENADTVNRFLADIYTIDDSLYLAFENRNEKNHKNIFGQTQTSLLKPLYTSSNFILFLIQRRRTE